VIGGLNSVVGRIGWRLFAGVVMIWFIAMQAGAQVDPVQQAGMQPADTLSADTLLRDSLPADSVPQLLPLTREYVEQDRKIELLLKAHREAARQQRGIPGYRVHLYMDSGNRARLNTQREQADFENKYPGVNAYIIYEEPYFKLRVGDFGTRLDARRFLEKIRRDYASAYIVVDMINFPEPD